MARVTVREEPQAGLDLADRIAFCCFFLSGVLGLVYEIAWIKKASVVFGSATFALSTVVAVFFGGLALGSFVFGRVAARTERPLRLYARIEVGLGLLALLSPVAFVLCDVAYAGVYPATYTLFPALMGLRLGLTALVLLPPTFLMGATLPLFASQYVTRRGSISQSVGFLYGLNTLGAACGCFAAGFWLLPSLGVDTSIYAAGVLNVALGLVVGGLAGSKRVVPAEDAPAAEEGAGSSPRSRSIVAFLFLVSGGVILANEILWARYLTLLVRNTVYTWTLTLGVILVGIVVGTLVSARHFDTSEKRALHFGGVQVLTGLSVLFVLFLPADWWRDNFVGADGDASLLVFGLVLLVPAVLSGVAFPLAVRMVVDRPQLAAVGVGRMAALNTFGGIAGSLLAGFWMLPALGLETSVRLTSAASLALGFTAWFLVDGERERLKKLAFMAAGAGGWILLPPFLGTRLPDDFLARDADTVVAIREGRNANLAVLDRAGVRILEIDRLWQGEDRKTHQIMAAHVPMLVHPDPKKVCVIGLGTGQTASRFLYYEVESLDCVDIEAELPELVREHFEGEWLDDPRVSVLAEDGRNYLSYTDRSYDVISVEVGQTFRPGVSSFYTREFYERARAHLEPDGLLCQFVPIMFLNLEESRGIVRTFLDVFPESSLWYNTGELLLIGTSGPSLRLSNERLRLVQSDARLLLDLDWSHWGGQDERLSDPSALLGSYLMGATGLFQFSRDAESYVDDLPRLDYSVSAVRDPREELEVVEALKPHLESVADVLDREDGLDLGRAATLRRANLEDVRAASMGRAGLRLLESGEYRDARELFRRALQVNPRNVAIRLYHGDAIEAMGETRTALREYEVALGIDPDRPTTLVRLARLHDAQGDVAKAYLAYQSLFAQSPDDYDVALAYARLANTAGDHGRAEGALTPFGDRDDAELHFQRGRSASGRKRWDEAVAHYERCLALDPERVEARVNLGNVHRSRGELDEAIAQYKQAIRVRPGLIQAHYNLSVALSMAERYDEALVSAETCIRLDERFYAAYDHLGSIHYRQERYAKAVEMYEKALAIKPDFANAARNLERARARL